MFDSLPGSHLCRDPALGLQEEQREGRSPLPVPWSTGCPAAERWWVISLVVQAGPAEQSHPLPSAQILPRPHTLGMLSFGENVTHNSHKACASFPPPFFSERGRSDWTPEASGCVELLILLSLLVVVAVMTSLPSFLPVNLRQSVCSTPFSNLGLKRSSSFSTFGSTLQEGNLLSGSLEPEITVAIILHSTSPPPPNVRNGPDFGTSFNPLKKWDQYLICSLCDENRNE